MYEELLTHAELQGNLKKINCKLLHHKTPHLKIKTL